MPETDPTTEKIRLEKIVDQIDMGSTGFVQSVNDMFDKTADLYFANIRPPTPVHLKSNTVHELNNY